MEEKANNKEIIFSFILKSLPLGILKLFAIISFIIFFVCILLSYSLIQGGKTAEFVVYAFPSSLFCMTFFSVNYCIIKAAWIYIEKNKTQEKAG